MEFEENIFKKRIFNEQALTSYGFVLEGNIYKYTTEILKDFKVEIIIKDKKVTGHIYDLSLMEEYTNFRLEQFKGEFVNSIRSAYEKLLTDIADQCCHKQYFCTPQGNRIGEQIIKIYKDEPEFLWKDYPDFAIFRNPQNRKWYALIAYIDKNKFDKTSSGKVEFINVKVDENEVERLHQQDGFYPAYHMNKKSWITILLDDTISDEMILEYVKNSHYLISS